MNTRRTRGGGRLTKEGKAAVVSERDFQRSVVELATALGWMIYHQLDAGTCKKCGAFNFSKRIGPGYPDLTLAGHGRVLFVELKAEKGRVSTDQKEWAERLDAGPGEYYLFRPSQWDEVVEVLQ